ncbi:MAG: site-specific DNA-methyltransferase [Bifidobacteriaceae bacterium]|nr:site-specific DNA-methyltransferase [Bifidobacteriaceae bacterium]
MTEPQPAPATDPAEGVGGLATPVRLAEDPDAVLHPGDALDVLPRLAAASVHAVITDPPYGIGMDTWDEPAAFTRIAGERGIALDGHGGALEGFRAWTRAWAEQASRVLKPGGWLVCFGGSRTWHHTALGIEQAGYQVKDQIAWLYTSGVPKSLDVSNAIDQHLGHPRPDRRICKPRDGLLRGRRVADKGQPATMEARRWAGWGTALAPAFEPIIVARAPTGLTVAANVLAHGAGAVNTAAGTERGGGRWPKNAALDHGAAMSLDRDCAVRPGDRSGLFPVFRHHQKATQAERPVVGGAAHQTVKPLGLMRWLCALFCPPGGTVLDPFAGTGTTLEAARETGADSVGVELDPINQSLIQVRLDDASRARPML